MRDEQMTDAALDDEIARAMTVDPSPAFVARVRQQIEVQPVSRAWTLTSWMGVATGAAVAAALLFVISWRGQRITPSMPALPGRAIPVANVPVVMRGARMLEHSPVARLASGPPRPRAALATKAEPEILIDPREARALRMFLDGVVTGRVDLTPLLGAFPPPILNVGPPSDIDIAPIELSPLTEKGVPQ
jgi:hypothetical protein